MMVGKTRRPSAVITMPVLPIVHHTTYEALREVSPCSAREAAPPDGNLTAKLAELVAL
jgi:hypothetical protein